MSSPQPNRVPRARLLLAGLILSGVGVLVGCALFFGPSADELTVIREVVREEQPLVIDVRSPGEFEDGHLQGAVNIPVGSLQDSLDELGAKDRPLVVY